MNRGVECPLFALADGEFQGWRLSILLMSTAHSVRRFRSVVSPNCRLRGDSVSAEEIELIDEQLEVVHAPAAHVYS